MSRKQHTQNNFNLKERPRRLRKNENIRRLVTENEISASNFVLPVFIEEGRHLVTEIKSLSGIYRYSPDELLRYIKSITKLNIPAIALFPKIQEKLKSPRGDEALNPKGLIPKVVNQIKNSFPDLVVITDVALDPYSSEGHDGIVKEGKVLNDESLQVLSQMALVQAKAGADFVAPSDMMDGRVQAIRNLLDFHNYYDTGIIAYTAKYASSFYGPFRDALNSAPKKGDKKTYQMNPANSLEAIREARLDVSEGADILLVKPALCYLDIIAKLKANFDIPIAAYNVSGEYAMLKAAAEKGFINESDAIHEMLLSIKRAGADIIFSYFAKAYLEKRTR